MQILAVCPHCGQRRAMLLTRAEFVEGWLEPQVCLIIVPETAAIPVDPEDTEASAPPAPEPRLGERRE